MNIVCLAGCDWTASWQPTQEIMTRLAQMGHRILYIDPTGTRNLYLSDWKRVSSRLKAKFLNRPPVTTYHSMPLGDWEADPIMHHPNITLYHPLILPFYSSSMAVRINQTILLRRIHTWLKGDHCDLLWIWFASPLNVTIARMLYEARVVYQIMSSIRAVRKDAATQQAEDRLIAYARHIFVNSATLKNEYAPRHPMVSVFRAGCDTTKFTQEPNPVFQRVADALGKPYWERPADLPTGKPIIGYSGSLHQWFDHDLWRRLADRLPQYHFVIITGKPHYQLPTYLYFMDVCLIPYKADAYTATSFPAKLMEYLAMGKPVVATRTLELEAFSDEFAVWLGLSSTVEEFEKNIHKAISGHTGLRGRNVRHIAIQHDYAQMVPKMLELLAC